MLNVPLMAVADNTVYVVPVTAGAVEKLLMLSVPPIVTVPVTVKGVTVFFKAVAVYDVPTVNGPAEVTPNALLSVILSTSFPVKKPVGIV